jgi:hypothetical protein
MAGALLVGQPGLREAVFGDVVEFDAERLLADQPAAPLNGYKSHLFVLVRFSNNCRIAVFVLFIVLIFLFFIIDIIGVSRRHRSVNEGMPGEYALGVACGHAGFSP